MESLRARPADLDGIAICRVDGCGATIRSGLYCQKCTEEMAALRAWSLRKNNCFAQDEQKTEPFGFRLLIAVIILGVIMVVAEVLAPFFYECIKFWGQK